MRSCSGTNVAFCMDMSVFASATIVSRWFVVSECEISQCNFDVNDFTRCDNFSVSRLTTGLTAAAFGGFHVGDMRDMYPKIKECIINTPK